MFKTPAIARGLDGGNASRDRRDRQFAALLLGLSILAAVTLAAGGYAYYRHVLTGFREEAEQDLQAIAALKVAQLAAWRSERLADARVNTSGLVGGFVGRWMRNGGERGVRAAVGAHLASLRDAYGYLDVVLASPDGRVLLGATSDDVTLAPEARMLVAAAAAARAPVFGDFYADLSEQAVRLDVAAPILEDGRPAAVLLLRIQPARFLYPLLQSWPKRSESGETLLVRREGSHAVFLNPLRHRPDPALQVRVPLAGTALPATQVVLGARGATEGKDYRGVRVLAHLRAVPDSPWFLVSKVDADEAFASAQTAGVVLAVLAWLGIATAGLIAGLFINRRETRLYQHLYQTEHQLSRSRAILSASNDAVFVVDPATARFIDVNDTACTRLGYARGALLAMTVQDLDDGAPAGAQWAAMVRETRETGGRIVESRLRTSNGRMLPVELGMRHLQLDGRVYIVATARDLTERQAAEHALRDSEVRFKALVEHAPDAYYLLECDGRLVDGNKAAEQMTGYAREELIGENLLTSGLLAPADIPTVAQVLEQTIAGIPAGAQEYTLRRKDGGSVIVEVRAHLIGLRDRPFILGIARDITERKTAERERTRLEEQLRVSQRMEAIGRLAGGVAHDFNNLLSVIVGYTDLALDQVDEASPIRNELEEIRKAGERAAALTRQLLAFSRKQVLQPMPLNLNEIAGGIEKMLQRIIGEDIALVQVLGPDLGSTLADRGQMEQVIMNLVVNARDAMPAGGTLTIETANVEVDQTHAALHPGVTPGPYVLLAVTDTGCGMDDDTRLQVFEPFFTTKPLGQGTGLGLSIVYGIVRQSGGSVWVYSEPGKGTTFKIYLPREAATALPAAEQQAGLVQDTGRETVLVVEDADGVRHLVEATLVAAGYTVLTAERGAGAVTTALRYQHAIDLVLTDVVMPEMNGHVLVQHLLALRPSLKVLYMSGYADTAILSHGVLENGAAFISKPFTCAALRRQVRDVLDDTRIVPAAVAAAG